MSALVAALRARLDGEVADDDYTRHLFSRDASMYSILPLVVVYPHHADDVRATVSVAAEHGVPVLPAARAPASPVRPSARGSCSTSPGT